MNFQKEDTRIFATNAQGQVIAEVTFPQIDDAYCINHTFVDESLRGQGIASQLVEMAVTQIEQQGGRVMATCPYAMKWLEKNRGNK